MIKHNKPTIGPEEKKAIDRVIRSRFLSSDIEVKKFENEMSNYLKLGDDNAVALSNGTSALFILVNLLNKKKRDVIIPSYSCSSLLHAIRLNGSNAKILDVDQNFPNLNTKLIGKKKNLIIYAQMYGLPSAIPTNLRSNLIEDACQSLGAKVKNISVGLQGIAGVFSFYATKIITSAGQGGMIVSKDKSLIKEIKDFINFDMRKDDKFRFNFQMTETQAAFGRAQLKKLNFFISKRKKIFNFYKKLGLNLMENKNSDINQVFYRSIAYFKNPNRVIKILKKNKVECINPLEKFELLSKNNKYKNSLKFTGKTVSLPCYPSLTTGQLQHISKALKEIKSEF